MRQKEGKIEAKGEKMVVDVLLYKMWKRGMGVRSQVNSESGAKEKGWV